VVSGEPRTSLSRAERIERMRMRIGVPVELPPPFNTEAHPDSMRHYARGFGDPNPLFCDPGYGEQSCWGTMIAAPLYITTLKRSDAGPMPEHVRNASRGAFAGIGAYYGGSRWEFAEPVRPGDKVAAEEALISVHEQHSATYGTEVIRADTRAIYHRESDGARIAQHTWRFFHVDRSARPAGGGAAEERRRDGGWAEAPVMYSEEEIELIEAELIAERPRGATPRYAEEVAVGDPVPGVVKGPMRVSDILAWRIGNGPGSTQWGAFRLMAQTRQRIPAFFTKNPFGAWDIVQRLHWEPEWAAAVGQPRPFDEGPMREAWLVHAVTDWMGDSGWLESIETRLGGFNYVGDLTRVRGQVTEVSTEGRVTLELVGRNQGDAETCSAVARVRLPTRGGESPR
jgi:acyl dehydratase